jgi:hypothetical protein
LNIQLMQTEDKDKRIKELEEELSQYKPNGVVALYYELNRFVNNTVSIMRDQGLKNLLAVGKDEDPKKFERMMALIKNAKEHVSDMADIKSKLRLSGDEKKDTEDMPFIESFAETRK